MMNNRKLGPNFKRLMAYKVARDALPRGGNLQDKFQAGMDTFTGPGRLAALTLAAIQWCDEAINVMRSAPDNPYGNDEETIAGAIVKELENHHAK